MSETVASVVDRMVAEVQVAGLHASLLTAGIDQPYFPLGG